MRQRQSGNSRDRIETEEGPMRMHRRTVWRLVGPALLVWIAVLSVPAATAERLRGSVVGNGGSTGTNGIYRLLGTAGQAAVGVSASNYTLQHGYWSFGGARTVAVEPPGPAQPPFASPLELELGPATPNPVRDQVVFMLAMPKAGEVLFCVYDVRGRRVGGAYSARLAAGYHRLVWNPSESGSVSGVYFARVWVDGQLLAKRRIVHVE
jgi:hypothetical protein